MRFTHRLAIAAGGGDCVDIQQMSSQRDNGFEAAAAQIGTIQELFDYAITCQIVSVNPATRPTRFITRAVLAPGTIADEIKKYLRTLYASISVGSLRLLSISYC